MSLEFDMLLKIGIVAAVLFVVWKVLQPKYNLKIVVNAGTVQEIQGVAKGKQAELTEFLEKDLATSNRFVIFGQRQANGRLQLRFRGQVDVGKQQQIRNYLLLIL